MNNIQAAECQSLLWCDSTGAFGVAGDAEAAKKARGSLLCVRGEHLCNGERECPSNVDETEFCRECGAPMCRVARK